MKSILLLLMLLVDTICIRCIFGNVCSDLVYMKIAYTENLLVSSYPEKEVRSVKECLENCRDDAYCKSVGIKVNPMTCVMYQQRVYAGQPIAGRADMVYYWQLEDECPTDLGYEEDPTSKICSKYSTTTSLSWSDAQAQCEKDGGHLFLADTKAKRAILKRYIEGGVFLGATDSQEEGVWNWLNGVPVDRSQFNPNEPNNVFGEHCLILTSTANYNDITCSNKNKFVCEVPTKQAYSPP